MHPLHFNITREDLLASQESLFSDPYQGIKDLNVLNGLCEKKDFATILDDPQLFWLLFCREYIDTKVDHLFQVQKVGSKVKISFQKNYCQDVFKFLTQNVDVIRIALKEAMAEGRPFELAFIGRELASSLFGNFLPAQAEYDISDMPLINGLQKEYCQAWILPTLPALAQALGVTCTCSQKLVTTIENKTHLRKIVKQEEFHHIKFEWNQDVHLVYPIVPKKIVALDFPSMIERFYQDKKFCDFTLQSVSGSQLPVHGMILQMVGGTFFQTMLATQMEESKSKLIKLDCSHEVATVFLEFIYRGADKTLDILKKSDNLGAILFEIFTFANQYQIQNLIDASANWITLFTQAEHLESLQTLAQLYNNDHLKKYCAFLQPPTLAEMSQKV